MTSSDTPSQIQRLVSQIINSICPLRSVTTIYIKDKDSSHKLLISFVLLGYTIYTRMSQKIIATYNTVPPRLYKQDNVVLFLSS